MASIKFEIDGKIYDFAPESFAIDNEGNIILKSKSSAKPKSPFERAGDGKSFYVIDSYGEVVNAIEGVGCSAPDLFEVANYCTDKNFFDGALSMKNLNGVCGVFLWRMVEAEITILLWIEYLEDGLFLILLLKDSDPRSRLLKLVRVQLRK